MRFFGRTVSAACGLAVWIAAATSISTQAQVVDELPVVFEDHFDNADSGWLVYSRNKGVRANPSDVDYSAGYSRAGYFIFDNQPNDMRWSANPVVARMGLSDASFEVDASKGTGPDASSGYGIACRMRGELPLTDRPSFYALIVTGDGQSGLARVTNGTWSVLSPLAPSTAVQPGNAANRLQLDCFGSTITGKVNGEVVARAEDDTLTDGSVGLWTGTQDEPGTGVVFTRAVVRAAHSDAS